VTKFNEVFSGYEPQKPLSNVCKCLSDSN